MLTGERNPHTEDLDLFFKFDEDGVKLSYFCNWRLTSLDETYEKVFGAIVLPCTRTRTWFEVRSREIKSDEKSRTL